MRSESSTFSGETSTFIPYNPYFTCWRDPVSMKKSAHSSTDEPQRVLVIQTAFIGDTILATALLEKIHRCNLNAELDLLIRKGNEGLFKNHPFIRNLFTWDKSGWRKYLKLASLALTFRAIRYHYCINLHRHSSSGLLTLLSGARTSVGFTMNPLSRFFTWQYVHKIDVSRGLAHEIDLYLQLATPLTGDTSRVMPKLYPSPDDFSKVVRQQPYVTIAPASVWFTKQLPAEKWCTLINNIDKRISILLIGAAGDYAQCENIKQAISHPSVYNLAGKLSLLQSAALMQRSLMNYANDSSPVHLASAVGAPVTALFCSTVPAFGYGPLGENGTIVESHTKLPCRPCGPHGHRVCPEGHFRCAHDIRCEEIPVPDAATFCRDAE